MLIFLKLLLIFSLFPLYYILHISRIAQLPHSLQMLIHAPPQCQRHLYQTNAYYFCCPYNTLLSRSLTVSTISAVAIAVAAAAVHTPNLCQHNRTAPMPTAYLTIKALLQRLCILACVLNILPTFTSLTLTAIHFPKCKYSMKFRALCYAVLNSTSIQHGVCAIFFPI